MAAASSGCAVGLIRTDSSTGWMKPIRPIVPRMSPVFNWPMVGNPLMAGTLSAPSNWPFFRSFVRFSAVTNFVTSASVTVAP